MDTQPALPAVRLAPRPPTVEECDRIVAMEPGALRNLRITHTYHRLTAAMDAALGGGGANWCAFAVWASKQAGQTIRGEDLPALLAEELDPPPEVAGRISRAWRRMIRGALEEPRTRLGRLLREVADPGLVFRHASRAISAGNHKVFAEIGREFARWLEVCGPGPVPDAVLEGFLAEMKPGPLPDGQETLRQAFRHYARAAAATDPGEKAEWLLLANVEIGLHEQTRLQPELLDALDAPLSGVRALGARMLAVLFPGAPGWPSAARAPLEGALGGAGKVAQFSIGRLVRSAVTEAMMRLALPGGTVRIGREPAGGFPPSLREPANPDLVALLERFRPAAGDRDGAGASDWSVLEERMQLISRVFRLYQEDARLLQPPFTAPQVLELEAGRVPDGQL